MMWDEVSVLSKEETAQRKRQGIDIGKAVLKDIILQGQQIFPYLTPQMQNRFISPKYDL